MEDMEDPKDTSKYHVLVINTLDGHLVANDKLRPSEYGHIRNMAPEDVLYRRFVRISVSLSIVFVLLLVFLITLQYYQSRSMHLSVNMSIDDTVIDVTNRTYEQTSNDKGTNGTLKRYERISHECRVNCNHGSNGNCRETWSSSSDSTGYANEGPTTNAASSSPSSSSSSVTKTVTMQMRKAEILPTSTNANGADTSSGSTRCGAISSSETRYDAGDAETSNAEGDTSEGSGGELTERQEATSDARINQDKRNPLIAIVN